MRGIRSFMGWTHILDMDTTTGSSEDYPFAGPKLQTPGKISVQLPTDEWLCQKLSKLNLTLTDGYPSRSAEASRYLEKVGEIRPGVVGYLQPGCRFQ